MPSWFEHVDLMQVVIGLMFLGLLWFIARTLSKIDTNQSLLFTQMTELAKEFHILKGEHQAIKGRCKE